MSRSVGTTSVVSSPVRFTTAEKKSSSIIGICNSRRAEFDGGDGGTANTLDGTVDVDAPAS